ncbi:MAG: hypothetical protein A2V66_06400 [Ignavibacteria bacterium RBG_13_36_8]|nr:MAG: hypothetical protein A2V66_06400 [Ignavibacteria bacterium RBG_13_36_8]
MTGKIVEVLAKILEALNNNRSLKEVNKSLSKNKEFNKQIVSVAFSLIYDRVLSNKVAKRKRRKKKSNKFRVLTEDEKTVIGSENYNYLMHLYNVGLLDNSDLEMVLEQIMMFPEETISRDDINWIILISLVDFNMDILPGSRVLLHSSDTIH